MNPKILLPWLVVAFPLGWGVYQSVLKSLPLFVAPPPAAAVTAPAKPVTPTGNSAAAPTPSTVAPAATPAATR